MLFKTLILSFTGIKHDGEKGKKKCWLPANFPFQSSAFKSFFFPSGTLKLSLYGKKSTLVLPTLNSLKYQTT